MGERLFRQGDFHMQSFGQAGFDYVTSGTINADTYIAITALEDSQLDVTASDGDSLTDVTIPKGLTIYGTFSSITVDSGKILAYRKATF